MHAGSRRLSRFPEICFRFWRNERRQWPPLPVCQAACLRKAESDPSDLTMKESMSGSGTQHNGDINGNLIYSKLIRLVGQGYIFRFPS